MLYLIPANSKAGKLIFSLFTPFDLILLVSGIVFSVLSLLIVAPKTFVGFIIGLLPAIICIALVVPIPNYHNIFTVLKETIEFFYNRRNYKWEGWCVKDEFKD
jgi:hypothetical protein